MKKIFTQSTIIVAQGNGRFHGSSASYIDKTPPTINGLYLESYSMNSTNGRYRVEYTDNYSGVDYVVNSWNSSADRTYASVESNTYIYSSYAYVDGYFATNYAGPSTAIKVEDRAGNVSMAGWSIVLGKSWLNPNQRWCVWRLYCEGKD